MEISAQCPPAKNKTWQRWVTARTHGKTPGTLFFFFSPRDFRKDAVSGSSSFWDCGMAGHPTLSTIRPLGHPTLMLPSLGGPERAVQWAASTHHPQRSVTRDAPPQPPTLQHKGQQDMIPRLPGGSLEERCVQGTRPEDWAPPQ